MAGGERHVTRRPHPGREAVLQAVENALDSGLYEVAVTQDGQPASLDRLVRCLDKAGLIDWRDICPLPKDDAALLAEATARESRDSGVRHNLDDVLGEQS